MNAAFKLQKKENAFYLLKKIILVCCCLFYSINYLNAQEWIGATGNWDDPNNWDTGTVPGNGDDVYITNGGTVIVNGSARSVNSVTLEDGTIAGTEELSMFEFYWYGGNVEGSGILEVTDYMEIDEFNPLSLSGRTLVIRGDSYWFTGDIAIASNGTMQVTDGALFSAEHGDTYTIGSGGGKFLLDLGGQFENTFSSTTNMAGEFKVEDGQLNISSGVFNLTSSATHNLTECTVNIGATGKISINAGTVNLGSTTDVFGAGWIDVDGGSLNLNGNNSVFAKVNFINGQIGGTSNCSFKSTFNWMGGLFNSTSIVSVTNVDISTANNKQISSGTLKVTSSGNWSGGDISVDAGATFETASGTSFTISHTGSQSFGSSSSGYIKISGLVNKTSNSLTEMAGGLTVSSTGTIKVNAGTFQTVGGSSGSYSGGISINPAAVFEVSGGIHSLNVGSVYGGGTFMISNGTFTCVAGTKLITHLTITGGVINNETALSPNNYEQSGGTFTGAGTATINGNMTWSNGTISGTGAMTVKGFSSWEAGERTLDTKTLTLEGNADWEGGDFVFANNTVISAISSTTIDVTHSGTQSASGTGSFEIHGVLEKYNLNSTTNINITFMHYGMAMGDGTITFGSLVNNGTVAPGMSVGQLTFNNFNNTSATLEMEIEGTGVGGVNFDLLQITNSGIFNGTLDVQINNGFVPNIGDAFQIIDCASCTGQFSTVNIPTLPSDREWEYDYDKGLTLLVVAKSLPVELSEFSLQLFEDQVQLEWVTESEANNKGFYVEKQIGMNQWQTLGFVGGFGNSFDSNQYYFNDDSPQLGLNYYRLKQVDYDGSFSYSMIRSIEFTSGNASSFDVFPNPASGGQINIRFNRESGQEGRIEIFDMTGKAIYEKEMEGYSYNEIQVLDGHNLTPGMYLIVHRTPVNRNEYKLIVK